ncbi:type II secretion system minor pseudopilin GspK [Rhodoferax sp.]|uniref:type II secretion system minor pseudopilin GspK n=1 Tax=Rhodoferax sp. TaxID=50421 RepID=UPI0025EE163F|nr:type II secretion system minor pseudopilin GspK [Rhodoferax sp.]
MVYLYKKSASSGYFTYASSSQLNSKYRQGGAALLMAMLTVTLVATLAAASLWQQWRSVEVEAAERQRVQSTWILTGALDWARLILREDGRSGTNDYLGEPWAVPLQESRLSTFLAADRNNTGGIDSDEQVDAFLSGQITDMQSRLNVTNLVQDSKISVVTLAAFHRLFELLNLPPLELTLLSTELQLAMDTRNARNTDATVPLLPKNASQLGWLGLSPGTVAALQPYVTVLPVPTPVNINTASAQVLVASVPNLSMAQAQKLVAARASKYFRSTADANDILNQPTIVFNSTEHGVATNYFEVLGRLRMGTTTVLERSLVRREGSTVTTVQRERAVADPVGQAAP